MALRLLGGVGATFAPELETSRLDLLLFLSASTAALPETTVSSHNCCFPFTLSFTGPSVLWVDSFSAFFAASSCLFAVSTAADPGDPDCTAGSGGGGGSGAGGLPRAGGRTAVGTYLAALCVALAAAGSWPSAGALIADS